MAYGKHKATVLACEAAEVQLKRDTLRMLDHVGSYVMRNYGTRCPEHEAGCPVCEMWARYDSIQQYTA